MSMFPNTANWKCGANTIGDASKSTQDGVRISFIISIGRARIRFSRNSLHLQLYSDENKISSVLFALLCCSTAWDEARGLLMAPIVLYLCNKDRTKYGTFQEPVSSIRVLTFPFLFSCSRQCFRSQNWDSRIKKCMRDSKIMR